MLPTPTTYQQGIREDTSSDWLVNFSVLLTVCCVLSGSWAAVVCTIGAVVFASNVSYNTLIEMNTKAFNNNI